MPLILDRQVLENIEALQNVLLASVTGGARSEGDYRRIREDLFSVPGLREVLPRFVRTCSDLSQFWHLIKAQNNMGSYAERREYIWNAFRPLLMGVDEEAGLEREVFFAKGSDHDAYVHIRGILQTAKTSLAIIDPYIDGSIYQVLGTLTPPRMAIRILASKYPPDFALETRKFMKQHPGFAIEVRSTKDFHDRFIFLDRARCFLLGASIKDAGNKGFTVVRLQEPSIVQFISDHADQVWAVSAPL